MKKGPKHKKHLVLRRIRKVSCTSKARYNSAEKGEHAIFRLHLKLGYQGDMNSYHCKFCGGFHIGHKRAKNYVVL